MSSAGREVMIPDAELVDVVRRIDKPFVTTGDLEDMVEMSKDGIRRRLNQLVEAGLLKREKVGSRAVVYWAE